VAPGQTPGALRFVSLALHILPHKGERRRRNVSARNASEPYFHPETGFSKARPLLCYFLHTPAKESRHTTSLDELAEPNYYSKPLETSSTRLFASHWRAAGSLGNRGGIRRLPIPATASTLQVFQFIHRAGLHSCRERPAYWARM